MAFPTDLEIARAARLKPLGEIAANGAARPLPRAVRARRHEDRTWAIAELADAPRAKYVVSARSPQPRWEKENHHDVGIGQGFKHIGSGPRGHPATAMGPTFSDQGRRGGGGYSQVVPMEALNLHSPATCTRSPPRTTCSPR